GRVLSGRKMKESTSAVTSSRVAGSGGAISSGINGLLHATPFVGASKVDHTDQRRPPVGRGKRSSPDTFSRIGLEAFGIQQRWEERGRGAQHFVEERVAALRNRASEQVKSLAVDDHGR